MKSQRVTTFEFEVGYPLAVADLRAVVEAIDELPDDAVVEITKRLCVDQRDPEPSRTVITIKESSDA